MTMTASDEGTTSAVRLPSRKTYLTTLSTVAFITGLGIATFVTIRKGKKMRLEELQSSLHTTADRAGIISSPAVISKVEEGGNAASQGPISLFKEMNRAVFRREGKRGEEVVTSDAPSVLLSRRGKQAKVSVFDSTSDAPPPSVLMRASAKSREKESFARQAEPQTTLANEEMEQTKQAEILEDTGESPVVMAVKAIGIATALVGTGAFLAWEIARRALGVQNVDELVDRLADVIPSHSRNPLALEGVGGKARTSLRSLASEQDEGEAELAFSSMEVGEPLSMDEALEALDEAARNGEATKWVSILSRQLNAEREQDLYQRRQRLLAKRESLGSEHLSV
ncbi:hypothetical protein CBS101457_000625 [Exobasidium rhododendri]|nr:hypothetical protein CBS101457_000625 [Exobasidium rhododendri]